MFWFKFGDRVFSCVLKLRALQEKPGSFQVGTSCAVVGSVSRLNDSAAVILATPGCTAAKGGSGEGGGLGGSERWQW